MPNREPKAATYLAAVLATEDGNAMANNPAPYQAAKDAEKLVSLGKRAARIAMQRCNGIERYDSRIGRMAASWTEDDDARADKQEAAIVHAASVILAEYDARIVSIGGDPRGYNLTFRLASGRSNSFDGKSWGV